ncbi:MAG: hypothetical protein PHC60_00280 [Heliobacteriaceae bacterium]|nr:hypothetical protein [Heliobacteriaceae bacterium]MDD4586818.1 hypothetical protein [Heliobacteriaceae bacterium]
MTGEQRSDLERKIFRLLDQIIDEASQISMLAGPYREERFQEGIKTVEQLAALCEELVDGRQEYVHATVEQLLQQRLPHPAVMRSFGEFQNVLAEYIRAGLALTPQAGEISPELLALPEPAGDDGSVEVIATMAKPESQPPTEFSEVLLVRNLRRLYPTMEVIVGGPVGMKGIAAYIPAKKLVVIGGPIPKTAGRRELACRNLGLRIVYVLPMDMHSPTRLKRCLLQAGFPVKAVVPSPNNR